MPLYLSSLLILKLGTSLHNHYAIVTGFTDLNVILHKQLNIWPVLIRQGLGFLRRSRNSRWHSCCSVLTCMHTSCGIIPPDIMARATHIRPSRVPVDRGWAWVVVLGQFYRYLYLNVLLSFSCVIYFNNLKFVLIHPS